MPSPSVTDGAARVHTALRLGWSLSELRGRYRERLADSRTLTEARLRSENALPLQGERTPAERAIELEAAIAGLAAALNVDVTADLLSDQPDKTQGNASDVLLTHTRQLIHAHQDDTAWPQAWHAFTHFLFTWDAKIQDQLFARSLGEANAYQVGRGLAEVYWALDPEAPSEHVTSWSFLLGSQRAAALTTLLRRTSPFYDELAISAVIASLDAWTALAQDAERRSQAGAHEKAHEQVGVWHDLLLDQVEPRTMIPPNAVLREGPKLVLLLRPFMAELFVAAGGVVLLMIAAAALATSGRSTLGAITAVLGVFGVTAAGVRATLKDKTRDLISQMRRAVYMELVARAVTRLPGRTSTTSAA
jgi:hypothetical protein